KPSSEGYFLAILDRGSWSRVGPLRGRRSTRLLCWTAVVCAWQFSVRAAVLAANEVLRNCERHARLGCQDRCDIGVRLAGATSLFRDRVLDHAEIGFADEELQVIRNRGHLAENIFHDGIQESIFVERVRECATDNEVVS